MITNNGKIIRKYAYGALSDNSSFEKMRSSFEKMRKILEKKGQNEKRQIVISLRGGGPPKINLPWP